MIIIDPTKAAELALNGTENNPILFWDNLAVGEGLTTSIGTEQEAASLSATGTTYDAWIATPAAGEAALQLELTAPQSLNCVAITAHNIGTIGATVRVEYSTNSGGTWQDSGAGPETPGDDQAILFYFDDQITDFWRIRVTGAGANDVEISVAFWGNSLTIPQRIYQGYTPPIVPNMVDLQSNVSEGGNLLGAAVTRKGSMGAASLTYIEPTFIRGDDFKGFMNHYNEGRGFFWAWRPEKYGDLFYAWRSGETIKPTNSGPKDLMSFEMTVRFYDQP